eukprot:8694831-Prorocentrum_lima.AAC.1
MTSSLVGSEMCIRDSVCPSGVRTHKKDACMEGAAASLSGHLPGGTGNPVSYTHLTLPTICSV